MFNVLDVRMLDGLCCINKQKSISTLDTPIAKITAQRF